MPRLITRNLPASIPWPVPLNRVVPMPRRGDDDPIHDLEGAAGISEVGVLQPEHFLRASQRRPVEADQTNAT